MRVNGFIPDINIFNQNNTGNTTNNSSNVSFDKIFKEAIDKVNDKQIIADDATHQLITGGDIDAHEVMLATEEAKMSLQMAVQVRNKLVEAVQELTKMQL